MKTARAVNGRLQQDFRIPQALETFSLAKGNIVLGSIGVYQILPNRNYFEFWCTCMLRISTDTMLKI